MKELWSRFHANKAICEEEKSMVKFTVHTLGEHVIDIFLYFSSKNIIKPTNPSDNTSN
jgi:hypothetical protein